MDEPTACVVLRRPRGTLPNVVGLPVQSPHRESALRFAPLATQPPVVLSFGLHAHGLHNLRHQQRVLEALQAVGVVGGCRGSRQRLQKRCMGSQEIIGGIPVKCSAIWYIICALPSGWCCRCCMNGEFMEDQSPAVPLETADIVMKLGHA